MSQKNLRPEQKRMLELIEQADANGACDALNLLEAGTGTGKTLVGCLWALEGEESTLIAVPTLLVGQQWIKELTALDAQILAQPVWGQSHYENKGEQSLALNAAASARLVICSHHMLPKLMAIKPWRLLVDEVHLLPAAIASRAGKWMPASRLGEWFERWCMSQLLLAGQTSDVPLAGRVRDRVIRQLKAPADAQVAASMDADGQLGVSIRSEADVDDSFTKLWHSVSTALLMSATISQTSASGFSSTRLLMGRLQMPTERSQFLGRVRAPWRDSGVTVMLPARESASADVEWLCMHASRKQDWAQEVALVLKGMDNLLKTLVLTTSYADAQAIGLALMQACVKGVIVDERSIDQQHMQLAFSQKQVWCWIATGSAWTGFDSQVPLQRLVIAKLPLPAPATARDLASVNIAQMDSVFRFRQGLGRLVRSDAASGAKEIWLLDGRIHKGAWWRDVCQPYRQVLSEDYETHRRFGVNFNLV